MSFATQMSTARYIVRAAERQIKTTTGLRVALLLCPSESNRRKPEYMMRMVASTLNIGYEYYKIKTRKREIVEMRFIASLLLRRYFPQITLKQIGIHFGGQDHTSIINGIARGYKLLESHDPIFTYKYNNALNSVNQWLKEQ